jgi:hypothetical protein
VLEESVPTEPASVGGLKGQFRRRN